MQQYYLAIKILREEKLMALTNDDLKNVSEKGKGVDPANPGIYADLLQDLQGNILKSHGRDHSVHLFLEFKPGQVDQVKSWIQDFSNKYVTSAHQQAEEAINFKRDGTPGEIFANFFLSSKGYEYLEFPEWETPEDQAFINGMKAYNGNFNDPPVNTWDQGFQSNDIHALVLIADDDVDSLLQEVNLIMRQIAKIADILQREDGFVLRNSAGTVIEHFGFADGVSQPLFLKRDILRAKINDGDFSKWDPRAPLDLVLVKDPLGKTDDSYGSYLVYRKLEQDVKAFRSAEKFMANQLEIDKELAGAYMVGRFADGTPVTLSDESAYVTSEPSNNFNYDEDPVGDINQRPAALKCPFQSHIRKTNPRGDTGRITSAPNLEDALADEKMRRIARRAISYGVNDLSLEPEKDSGLLFLCFQADIQRQFNFMQINWANQTDFVRVGAGTDPIIGQTANDHNLDSGNDDERRKRQWPTKWGEAESKSEAEMFPNGGQFNLWVHLKGGEYFFAPSMSFLKTLVPTQPVQPTKQAAQGSSAYGKNFDILPQAPSRISRLIMHSGWAVDKLQVEYEDLSSKAKSLSPAAGGPGGGEGEFSISEGDYITDIFGAWGRQAPGYPKEEIVSLKFKTKNGQEKSFGGENSQKEVEPFFFKAPEGHQIIGFFGAFGSHQNSLLRIGIYTIPVS
ncbi:MAG: Dyp-type peroxidase [Cyanobacteria bacterium P01_A01_bin.83]